MKDWSFEKIIRSENELREIIGYPSEIVNRKTINYIDDIGRGFIEQSTFITIATSDLENNQDVSPKGDPAGFVKVLNEHTLAIPDRPGNKKADTLRNILQNPHIGLIFFIPGTKETLRVNGLAQIVTDRHVLELLECNGKIPLVAIIVKVQEVFMHCAKCIIRSNLWKSIEETPDRLIPTLGKVLVEHGKLDIGVQELDDMIKEDEKTNLY